MNVRGWPVPNACRTVDTRVPSMQRALQSLGPRTPLPKAVALGTALRVTSQKFSPQHNASRSRGHPAHQAPRCLPSFRTPGAPSAQGSLAFEVGLSHHLLPTGLKLKIKTKPKLPLPPSVPVNFPPCTGARTLCGRRSRRRGSLADGPRLLLLKEPELLGSGGCGAHTAAGTTGHSSPSLVT